MKKIILVCIMAVLTFTLASCSFFDTMPKIAGDVTQIASEEELKKLFTKYEKSQHRYWYDMDFGGNLFTNEKTVSGVEPTADANGADYTKTNTQVEGVDEGDIIKVDSNYIYKLSEVGFVIVKVTDGTMEIVYQTKLENYVPIEVYIKDDMLVLIGGTYENAVYQGTRAIEPGICTWNFYQHETNIRVYNIADRTNPELLQNFNVTGYYLTSRIINNQLTYAVNYTNFNGYLEEDNVVIPMITDNLTGIKSDIATDDIYHFDKIINLGYLIIGSVDLAGTAKLENKAYLGVGGIIYVSENNLYVATADYPNHWFNGNDQSYDTYTHIARFSLDTLLCTASCKVDGTINDRFSMDEYNGYFRVASTVDTGFSSNNQRYSKVYVFNNNLKQVGLIDNIAPGERIYSVRFNKEEGALVTFQKIDPLFNLDLSDPTNPTISKGLKENGVSFYLHYIEGTDYVIGVGRDTVDSGKGFAYYQGIKVSLYDMSSGEAVNVGTEIIGNRSSYTEALYEPKAILYDKDRDIFALPIESWESTSEQNYYDERLVQQGLYVFGFSQGKLVKKAVLGNIDSVEYDNWYDYYDLQHDYVRRGARIGNYIYTISDKKIVSYNLNDFTMKTSLVIAEYPTAEEMFPNK